MSVGAQAPADNWAQFRGNARLTGIATSAPPAAPALRWTFEAGEAIDSSPAIADGTVYVATSNGDLVAIDLGFGQAAMEVRDRRPDRRIVAGGRRRAGVRRRSRRHGARRQRRRRQPALDVQDRRRGEVVADAGRRSGARSARTTPTCTRSTAAPAKSAGSCRPTARSTPRRPSMATWSTSPAATNGSAALRLSTGAVLFTITDRRLYGRVAARERRLGVLRHVQLRSARRRSAHEEDRLAVPQSEPRVSVLLVGGAGRRTRHRRRPRQDRPRHRRGDRQGRLDLHRRKARVDSSPAVAGGRVYIGSSDGRLYGLDAKTGDKQWEFDAGAGITTSPAIAAGPDRRRHAGRPRLLFRLNPLSVCRPGFVLGWRFH